MRAVGSSRERTLVFLAAVLVLVIGVGYLLFRFGVSYLESRRPEPIAAPTVTAGPVVVSSATAPAAVAVASPSPPVHAVASPSPAPTGEKMKIANTEGQGANLRQRPTTSAPVLRTVPEGTVVDALGSEAPSEGRNWRQVREPGGAVGWVAAELLAPE
ncbi:MAG: SH3 domain-containing protein [Chloroflexi bacterium]|nr:SH3 domain-containing protein [Chloroflexota bacterium]